MKVQEILAHKGGKVVTIRPDATICHGGASAGPGAYRRARGQRGRHRDRRHPVRARHRFLALAAGGPAILAPDRRVRDLMTKGVRTCRPDDAVKAVMAEMTRHRFRHMPVVEGGRLVGLVSIGDVVKTRLDEMELETVVLREAYIAGH